MTDILNIDLPDDIHWVDRAPETSLRQLIETRDWAAAGRLLVEMPAVPGMLATGRHPLLTRIEVAEAIGDAEPLLLAAVALGRRWPEVAAVAIERAERDLDGRAATLAEQLSLAVVKMAAARSRAQAGPGRQFVQEVLELMPRLSLGQRDRAPELLPMVESHLGLFALWEGAPDRAMAAFGRGARGCRLRPVAAVAREESAVQLVVADCVGQQSFLEAVAGELGSAIRHAADVLTARPADSTERGVVHAQLATVWVHTARGELAQARQRFESVSARMAAPGDEELRPGLAAAVALTGARLASVTGEARIGHDLTELCRYPGVSGFFADQFRSVRAEAELAAGRPARALQLLAEAGTVGSNGELVRARAWLAQGDRASAVAALRVCPSTRLSLLDQIQQEVLEARLTPARDPDRRRALISRALRTAEREQLRTPLRWAARWLRSVVGADPVLRRRHGTFVSSIRPDGADPGTMLVSGPTAEPAPELTRPPTAPLTRRELDILQRLAGMSTNEEIAGELFLSTNTIKTHLKSLYRKLDVTRRSDAVRHGRALGLC